MQHVANPYGGELHIMHLQSVVVQALTAHSVERNDPVLSVACSPETNSIVAGTELASSQAVVAFWYGLLLSTFRHQHAGTACMMLNSKPRPGTVLVTRRLTNAKQGHQIARAAQSPVRREP